MLKFFILLFSFILISVGKSEAAKIIDSKTGSINNINIKFCVWSSYDDHPEKMGLLANSIWVPLKIGLSPITMLTEDGLGMEHSSGHFLHDKIKPSRGKTVILKNLSFGSDRNKVANVYSIRKYNSKNGSEIIDFTRGRTHSNKFFIVRDGTNKINYEIINNKTKLVLEEGIIDLYVNTYREKSCAIDSTLDFLSE